MHDRPNDAYLRLHSTKVTRHSEGPAVRGGLVFIDLDITTATADEAIQTMKRVVGAPPGFFLHAAQVLVRWPAIKTYSEDSLRTQADAFRSLLTEWCASEHPVGIVSFPIGQDINVVWSSDAVHYREHERRLLARARAIELYYLLRSGNGIWNPDSYHYRLPSGEHSSTFVRAADSFKRPRDAAALATWLHPEVVDDLSIVIDSATILPLVGAIHNVMYQNDLVPGDTVALSDYPSNQFEVEQAVSELNGEKVLGILSVTSTGSTAERFDGALREAQHNGYALETLVSRSGRSAYEVAMLGATAGRQAWLGLAPAQTYRSREECQLCRKAERPRIVYIDPRGFEPMVLPRPELLTPDVSHAIENRDLWNAYDHVNGVGVHARPHVSTMELRSNRSLLAVRCYPHWLLDPERYDDVSDGVSVEHSRFLKVVTRRASVARKKIERSETVSEPEFPDRQFSPARVDLIVTTGADREEPGFESFIHAVLDGFGAPKIPLCDMLAVRPPYSMLSADVVGRVAGMHNILVVTLGSITGSTLQQLLVALHDAIAQTQELGTLEPNVGGIVMHARPEDIREWDVLHNAYTRIEALWLTPIPLRSPFEEEEELLAYTPLEEPEAAPGTSFLKRRLSFFGDADPNWDIRIKSSSTQVDPYAIFWGMPLHALDAESEGQWQGQDAPRLRLGSRYGQALRATTTFAAVGAAMQHKRLSTSKPKSAPVWRQFEMPAILRSYFDPPIVASILRWLEPHEAWWGDRPEETTNVLAETLNRAPDEDLKLLVPELLLAAALGKIPNSGLQLLLAEADHLIRCSDLGYPLREGQNPWTPEEIAPVCAAAFVASHFKWSGGDAIESTADRVAEAVEFLQGGPASVDRIRLSRAAAHLRRAVDRFFAEATPDPAPSNGQ